jgi:3-hydroxyisobutyrate dehydrogenase
MTNLQALENQKNVGFIGIGNMGFAMMARLLSQNWPVTAFDIDANAMQKAKSEGATLARHAGEIATLCRVTFLVVVDYAQVNEVLNGPHGYFSKVRAGDVLFLCPTLGPLDVSKFASQAMAKGVQLIDAPMSGGPLRAREGQMSFMLAGPQDVLKPLESLLNAITPHRFLSAKLQVMPPKKNWPTTCWLPSI